MPQMFFAAGLELVFVDCEAIIKIYTRWAAAEMQRPVGGVIANKMQVEITTGFVRRSKKEHESLQTVKRQTMK